MKLHKSYRLDEQRVKELNELVLYYRNQLTEAGIKMNVSPATVIEILIGEKIKEIRSDSDG